MSELTVRASLNNLNSVLSFVSAELDQMNCCLRACQQLNIAVEEIFVNIASYAYAPGEGDATIRVRTDPDSGMVAITFLDRGVPYNPLAKPDPDVTLSAEERQIGGLGIYMVKKSMDEMKYAYRNGQNILTIIKKLG